MKYVGPKRQSVLSVIVVLAFSLMPIFAQEVQPGAKVPLSRGPAAAPIDIEVFYDFQCPSCIVVHEQLKNLEKKYKGQVRITIRHFPLSIHDKSYDAAIAVEAAGLQGKFWEMTGVLYREQKRWSVSRDYLKLFGKYAKELGLDIGKFEEDCGRIVIPARIDLDIARARSLKLMSVPSVFLNGKLLSYPNAIDLDRFISEGN